jgi:hypothetical protein
MAGPKEIARIDCADTINSVAWSPQADALAAGLWEGAIRLLAWDADIRLAPQRSFTSDEIGSTSHVSSLCFDVSGQWLLFNTHPGGRVGLIHLRAGRAQNAGTSNKNGDSAFSPDGRQLAFHTNRALLIGPAGDLAAARAVYTHPSRPPDSLAWHPNRS